MHELLPTLHLLAAIFWIGGMVFILAILIPSQSKFAAILPPPLLPSILSRFIHAVLWAAIVLAGTGPWMRVEISFSALYVKLALAVAMILIYALLRVRYLKPLDALALRPADAPADPAQSTTLAGVRRLATINLGLSLAIVVLAKMG